MSAVCFVKYYIVYFAIKCSTPLKRVENKKVNVNRYTITYYTEFCTHTISRVEKRTSLIKLSINLRVLSIKCAVLLRLTHRPYL